MIVEIEKPRPSCTSSLNYNEGKVDMGVAEMIAASNVPGLDRESLYNLFRDYEKTRYPVREVSFHASVNPSEDDGCSEDDILEFISGMMGRLGLGSQPYLVYRHFDIDRMHYHIVSVRVDRDGRKINNFYENQKASKYIASVAQQYRFTVPAKGERVAAREDIGGEEKEMRRPAFKPGGADITGQIRDIFTYALTYDFDGPSQVCFILEDLGVLAVEGMDESAPAFTFHGLNGKGRKCTKRITESIIGLPLHEQCMAASISNRQRHHLHRREKERLQGLVSAAFSYSKSQTHFENILRNKGVTVHYSYTEDGDVFGITLIDHRTRCAFKASEIPSAISVQMMTDAMDSGHWRAQDRGGHASSFIRDKRREAKEDAEALRNLNMGVLSRVLKPVGQPHGNSWSGKTGKTEEDLKEEFEIERSGALNSSLVDRSLEEHLV